MEIGRVGESENEIRHNGRISNSHADAQVRYNYRAATSALLLIIAFFSIITIIVFINDHKGFGYTCQLCESKRFPSIPSQSVNHPKQTGLIGDRPS